MSDSLAKTRRGGGTAEGRRHQRDRNAAADARWRCWFPSPEWSVALLAPALFFDALAMGTAAAALQHIFPNQVRGQVSALYLFLLNLGGGSLGPLLPGVFNDYLFHDPEYGGIFARDYDRHWGRSGC